MVLHFFSELLILLDLLLEVTFKDFKALKDFCKEVVKTNPPWRITEDRAYVYQLMSIIYEFSTSIKLCLDSELFAQNGRM